MPCKLRTDQRKITFTIVNEFYLEEIRKSLYKIGDLVSEHFYHLTLSLLEIYSQKTGFVRFQNQREPAINRQIIVTAIVMATAEVKITAIAIGTNDSTCNSIKYANRRYSLQ